MLRRAGSILSSTRSFGCSARTIRRSGSVKARRSNPRNGGPATSTIPSKSWRRRPRSSWRTIRSAKRCASIFLGVSSDDVLWWPTAPRRRPGVEARSKTRPGRSELNSRLCSRAKGSLSSAVMRQALRRLSQSKNRARPWLATTIRVVIGVTPSCLLVEHELERISRDMSSYRKKAARGMGEWPYGMGVGYGGFGNGGYCIGHGGRE